MILDEFLNELNDQGESAIMLGQSIINEMYTMDYDMDNLNYNDLFTFITQENVHRKRELDLIVTWLKENLFNGVIGDDLYEDYLEWANDVGKPKLNRIEFGKLVGGRTKFESVPKYISAYKKTMRVFVEKNI